MDKWDLYKGKVVAYGTRDELLLVDDVKLKKFTAYTEAGRLVEGRIEFARATDREFNRATVDAKLEEKERAKRERAAKAKEAPAPTIGALVRVVNVRELHVVIWLGWNRKFDAVTYKVAPVGGTPTNSYRYNLTADKLTIVPVHEAALEMAGTVV